MSETISYGAVLKNDRKDITYLVELTPHHFLYSGGAVKFSCEVSGSTGYNFIKLYQKVVGG